MSRASISPPPARAPLSFGDAGRTFTTSGGYRDELHAMLPLADGRLVAGGAYDQNVGSGDFAVVRYLSNGRIDSGFGGECGWEREPRMNLLP